MKYQMQELENEFLKYERVLQKSVNILTKNITMYWDLPEIKSPQIIIITPRRLRTIPKKDRPKGIAYYPHGHSALGLAPHSIFLDRISKLEERNIEIIIEETAHAVINKYIPERRTRLYSTRISEQIFQEASADCIKRIFGYANDLKKPFYQKSPQGAKEIPPGELWNLFMNYTLTEFYEELLFFNDCASMQEYFWKMQKEIRQERFPQELGHQIGDRLGECLYKGLETREIKKEELKTAIFTSELPLRTRIEKLRKLAKRVKPETI
ncbi:MAG: hypothetical protein Q8R18_00910 [bacterium]|nr:hypothetical protein [bacterium]